MGARMGIIPKGCLALLCALALACLPAAGTEPSLFQEANRFYEKGNYAEAIEIYQALLSRGVSPEILFNLGNAWFQRGEVGRAILSYRRAQRLDPRDPAIRANLKYARQTVPGSVSIRPGFMDRALRYFTLDEIALTAAAALWIWMALLAAIQCQPNLKPPLKIPARLAAGAFALVALWLLFAYRAQTRPIAIVVAEQAPLRFGPVPESQIAYTANDGAELRLLGQRGDWLQVADRSNRRAWGKKGDLEVLLPSRP